MSKFDEIKAIVDSKEVWEDTEHDGPDQHNIVTISEAGESMLTEKAPHLLICPDYVIRDGKAVRNPHRLT